MTFIDTSVIVAFIAGDEKVVEFIKEFAKSEDLKTTTVTEYELLKNKNSLKKHLAEDLLSEMTICPFDSAAARKAASIYEKLRDTGKMINENDLLIAGISLANNEILLTRDKKLANINDEKIKII
jgi:predicted nucleic acid-binding protein